jgi:hypothetical protein
MATQPPDAALLATISSCRTELAELYAVVQQEQQRKLQRWCVHAVSAVGGLLLQRKHQPGFWVLQMMKLHSHQY